VLLLGVSADQSLRSHSIVEVVIAGRVDDIEALLLLGISPSTCDENKRSLVHHACRKGDTKVIAALSNYGANIEAQDYQVRRLSSCRNKL